MLVLLRRTSVSLGKTGLHGECISKHGEESATNLMLHGLQKFIQTSLQLGQNIIVLLTIICVFLLKHSLRVVGLE